MRTRVFRATRLPRKRYTIRDSRKATLRAPTERNIKSADRAGVLLPTNCVDIPALAHIVDVLVVEVPVPANYAHTSELSAILVLNAHGRAVAHPGDMHLLAGMSVDVIVLLNILCELLSASVLRLKSRTSSRSPVNYSPQASVRSRPVASSQPSSNAENRRRRARATSCADRT